MPEKNEVRDKCLTTENPFLVRKLQLAMIFESSDRIHLSYFRPLSHWEQAMATSTTELTVPTNSKRHLLPFLDTGWSSRRIYIASFFLYFRSLKSCGP